MGTKISWTSETWNPIAGCTRVSPGCRNCYAALIAHRFDHPIWDGVTAKKSNGVDWTGKINVSAEALMVPFHWRKPRNVFVNSMSDMFHPNVERKTIEQILNVIRMTPRHVYQILTKRPENIPDNLDIPDNCWIGVSIENEKYIHRWETLVEKTGSDRAWVSLEPLLGPVDVEKLFDCKWIVVGGESGHKSRTTPMKKEWVEQIYWTCEKMGIPFFLKQWGSHGPHNPILFGKVQEHYPEEMEQIKQYA